MNRCIQLVIFSLSLIASAFILSLAVLPSWDVSSMQGNLERLAAVKNQWSGASTATTSTAPTSSWASSATTLEQEPSVLTSPPAPAASNQPSKEEKEEEAPEESKGADSELSPMVPDLSVDVAPILANSSQSGPISCSPRAELLSLDPKKSAFLQDAKRMQCKCKSPRLTCGRCRHGESTQGNVRRGSYWIEVGPVVQRGIVPKFLTETPNETDFTVRDCFNSCGPSFFRLKYITQTLDVNDKDGRIHARTPQYGRSMTAEAAEETCGSLDTWKRHLIIVDRWGLSSMYHFMIDSVFTTWSTISMVATAHGAAPEDFDVAILDDNGWKLPVQFKEIWNRIFGRSLYINSTKGCYKTVTNGFFYDLRPLFWMQRHQLHFDAAVGPWMRSFRFAMQRSWQLTENQLNASAPWIYMEHRRMPIWLEKTQWWIGAPVPFVKRDQAKFSMADQIAAVSSSSGLASAEGAAFAHQLFLPPKAYLFIIQFPREQCGPQYWHSSVSQYLDLPTLEWVVCPAKFPFGAKGVVTPGSKRVHKVIKFFIKESAPARANGESFVCELHERDVNDSSPDACKFKFRNNATKCWDFRMA